MVGCGDIYVDARVDLRLAGHRGDRPGRLAPDVIRREALGRQVVERARLVVAEGLAVQVVHGLLVDATVEGLAQGADVSVDAVAGYGVVDDRLHEVGVLSDLAERHLGPVQRRERVVVPDVPADLDFLIEELGRAIDPFEERLVAAMPKLLPGNDLGVVYLLPLRPPLSSTLFPYPTLFRMLPY